MTPLPTEKSDLVLILILLEGTLLAKGSSIDPARKVLILILLEGTLLGIGSQGSSCLVESLNPYSIGRYFAGVQRFT